MLKKAINRQKRHYRIRKRVLGTNGRPRLVIKRSLKNLAVQVIDDVSQKTLYATSTLAKDTKGKIKYGGNVLAAKELAKVCAEGLKTKGIAKVCFDRAGYLYHGRVKALADGLREAGIKM
ncbi:MAG: 50S ribosomal protein L18 [Candidatus Omnitrophica bacterium]|nr:50S ribosomal protein L18 [Candidatus Omnitrophota bacterium]